MDRPALSLRSRRKEGRRVSDNQRARRPREDEEGDGGNSRVSRSVSDDSLDRASHLESSSSAHDDLDSGSLSLHELMRNKSEERRVSER